MERTEPPLRHNLLFLIGFLFTFSTPLICADSPFKLEWLTPPPPVVVSDNGKVYRIGCRITLNTTLGHQYDNSNLDNAKLWAVISKVSHFRNSFFNYKRFKYFRNICL